MSVGSTKYRRLAKESFKCVTKTLMLSPCDMAFEQRVKSKVTAKLLKLSPNLARVFYRNFRVFAWAFTATFFISLILTAYSFYNLAVYGSCEPGGTCYMTAIGLTIGAVEKIAAYLVLTMIIVLAVYLVLRRRRN